MALSMHKREFEQFRVKRGLRLWYTNSHTYIHTYIHTDSGKFLRLHNMTACFVQLCSYAHICSCIYFLIHTYIHTLYHSFIHSFIHTERTQKQLYTYLHTFIHTYIHTAMLQCVYLLFKHHIYVIHTFDLYALKYIYIH